jgi:hypothetical protein
MSGGIRPVYVHPGRQAEALGAALRGLGFTVTVLRTGPHQRHPCVTVDSGPLRIAYQTGYVYAAPGDGGDWWFWQPSAADVVVMERIAPLSDVSVTADSVARTLTRARVLGLQAS